MKTTTQARVALLSGLSALALFAGGCASSVNTVSRAEPQASPNYVNDQRVITDATLGRKVGIVSVNDAKVSGDMTIMGVTQPVTLDVKLNKIGSAPNNQKRQAGFTITGQISRKAFGSASAAGIIGDAVNTVFRLEALSKQLGRSLVLSHDFGSNLGVTGEFEDHGEQTLKGKSQTVRVYSLAG